jgi:hypothetical protein
MWILKQKQGLWHYQNGAQSALCGSSLPDAMLTRRQVSKPNGFDGLLCNRCWFRQELAQTLASLRLDSDRLWLEALDFGMLTQSDSEKLYAAIGEERADTLRIIYSLAESSETERDERAEPIVISEPPRDLLADLTAIPLLVRQPLTLTSVEPEDDFVTATSEPAEPRLKINCSRIPKERTNAGFARIFRRR